MKLERELPCGHTWVLGDPRAAVRLISHIQPQKSYRMEPVFYCVKCDTWSTLTQMTMPRKGRQAVTPMLGNQIILPGFEYLFPEAIHVYVV